MTSIFRNDTYQLSMLYAHWKNGRHQLNASAEAFFRRYPHEGKEDHNMVVMAAAYRLNELLNSDDFQAPFTHEDMPYVQNKLLHLTDEEFEPFGTYLLEEFPKDLASLDVQYARDGEILFWDFPVVQVTGPIGALHMLETPILSFLNTSVRAATIARRIRREVGPRISLLDFATRRQDDAAAIHTAVAAAIGGFDGTSNMEAGRLYDVLAKGTMAHSYVLSYGMDGELQAFQDFMRAYPENHVLLVDTFDIMKGVAHAIRASFATQIPLRAIRVDSGEWTETLPAIRDMLDMMGCTDTKIVVSGDYDEKLIKKLKSRLLPDGRSVLSLIDGIGIGSRLGSPDFSMGFVYKLVEVDGAPVMKIASGGKSSLPGRKLWLKSRPGVPVQGNALVLASNGPGEQEVVLQPDSGPFPVGEEYIREARALTALRVARNESYWSKNQVQQVAATLTCKGQR